MLDTAEDFGDGALLDCAVEPQGFVGPRGYTYGIVRARGTDSALFADATVTFEALAGQPFNPTNALPSLSIDLGSVEVQQLGLPSTQPATILIESEIELDKAGTWDIQLDASDIGFLEIAQPGSANFVRIAEDFGNGPPGSGMFEVAEPGWFRIRGAFANTSGGMRYLVAVRAPQTASHTPLPLRRIRASIDDLGGLAVEGFERVHLVDPRGAAVSQLELRDAMLPTNPFGFALGTSFTLRWSGHVLIERAGTWSVRITTLEGQRAWIADRLVSDAFGRMATDAIVPLGELAAGWYPVVIDVERFTGPDPARLTFVAVDEQGNEVPFTALTSRPAQSRIARAYTGAQREFAIPDNAAVTRSVVVDPPSDFTVQRAAVGFDLDHPALAQVSIALAPPVGPSIALVTTGSLSGSGGAGSSTEVNALGGTTWGFTVADNTVDTPPSMGVVHTVGTTLVGDGGSPPFAPRYRFESSPRKRPSAATLGPLSVGVRQLADSTVTTQVRSCDQPAECAAQPWVTAVSGAVPSIELRDYVQFAIEVVGDGNTATAIDFIKLAFDQ